MSTHSINTWSKSQIFCTSNLKKNANLSNGVNKNTYYRVTMLN